MLNIIPEVRAHLRGSSPSVQISLEAAYSSRAINCTVYMCLPASMHELILSMCRRYYAFFSLLHCIIIQNETISAFQTMLHAEKIRGPGMRLELSALTSGNII